MEATKNKKERKKKVKSFQDSTDFMPVTSFSIDWLGENNASVSQSKIL